MRRNLAHAKGLTPPKRSTRVRIPERLRTPAVAALVAANLAPLAGVLLFSWDLGEVMLLYWLESAVIGLFTVVKLALSRSWSALFLIPFFLVHFGAFMGAHLVFIVTLFLGDVTYRDITGLVVSVLLALAAFVSSHAVSFVQNHLRGGERERVTPNALFIAPYPRIVVMHVTLIFGAFLTMALGAPLAALALLIALKTGVDVAAHLRERRKLAPDRDLLAPLPR